MVFIQIQITDWIIPYYPIYNILDTMEPLAVVTVGPHENQPITWAFSVLLPWQLTPLWRWNGLLAGRAKKIEPLHLPAMLTTSQVQPFVPCLSLTYAKSKSKFVLLTKVSHPVFANSVFFYTQEAALYCQAVERIFLSRSMHNVHRPSQQVKDLFLT